MELSRRSFLKGSGTAALASGFAALGFGEEHAALAQAVRPYKLLRTTETRSICPYCSVSCGTLMYSLGDNSKNAKSEIIHVEGDPDNPVNRGTLCPRGAAILDFVHSQTRVKYPMHRKPGSDKFERVTWEFAVDRIAKLMKEDRDANFVSTSNDGVSVNRWPTVSAFITSSMANEPGYLAAKLFRSAGVIAIENQARI